MVLKNRSRSETNVLVFRAAAHIPVEEKILLAVNVQYDEEYNIMGTVFTNMGIYCRAFGSDNEYVFTDAINYFDKNSGRHLGYYADQFEGGNRFIASFLFLPELQQYLRLYYSRAVKGSI